MKSEAELCFDGLCPVGERFHPESWVQPTKNNRSNFLSQGTMKSEAERIDVPADSEAKPIDSLAKYFERIKSIRDGWNAHNGHREDIWFRGVKGKNYDLLPGVYRSKAKGYDFNEGQIFRAFKALAAGFVHRGTMDDWGWYFHAQHHSLPTRLLDWSDNVLVALYFAISYKLGGEMTRSQIAEKIKSRKNQDESQSAHDNPPVVWVLDARSLNRCSAGDGMCHVFYPGDEIIEGYRPDKIPQLDKILQLGKPTGKPRCQVQVDDAMMQSVLPVAIYPNRANDRIIAQQGTFTLHGWLPIPINALRETLYDFHALRLTYIPVNPDYIYTLMDELFFAGIHQLGLFPDFDHAAAHVRWLYE